MSVHIISINYTLIEVIRVCSNMEGDQLSQEPSDYGSPSPQSISDEGEQFKDSQSDSDNDVKTQNSTTNSSSKPSENESTSY